MGVVTFTQQHVIETGDSFPRFKLEKGDVKRIVCLENPYMAWTHNLRAPKILNGRPLMKKVKTKEGEEYETYEYDFIGNPICVGDEGILAEKFYDAQNCPACARSEISDSVRKPQRRFAMHVIEYTNVNSRGQVQDPFGVRTVVWGFTDTVFSQLVGFASEYTGGLPQHDLICGPCEDKQFQRFKIMPSEKAAWLMSEDRKALTIATFKGNRAPDLAAFCGSKKERPWIEEALKRVEARWNIVNGVIAVAVPGAAMSGISMTTNGGASLEQGLDGLLSEMASAPTAQQSAPAASTVDLDDLLGSTPAAPPAAPAAAPVAASSPAAASSLDGLADMEPEPDLPPVPKPGSSGETLDFESMLQGLGN